MDRSINISCMRVVLVDVRVMSFDSSSFDSSLTRLQSPPPSPLLLLLFWLGVPGDIASPLPLLPSLEGEEEAEDTSMSTVDDVSVDEGEDDELLVVEDADVGVVWLLLLLLSSSFVPST
jgi:hypothetical protein